MVLLVIVLSDAQNLEELLEGFLELGMEGATIVGAQGMGEFLAQEVPIFAGLRSLFPGGEGHGHRLHRAGDSPLGPGRRTLSRGRKGREALFAPRHPRDSRLTAFPPSEYNRRVSRPMRFILLMGDASRNWRASWIEPLLTG